MANAIAMDIESPLEGGQMDIDPPASTELHGFCGHSSEPVKQDRFREALSSKFKKTLWNAIKELSDNQFHVGDPPHTLTEEMKNEQYGYSRYDWNVTKAYYDFFNAEDYPMKFEDCKVLQILDDGHGMTEERMKVACEWNSVPSEPDSQTHISMFGTGMNNALTFLGPLTVLISVARPIPWTPNAFSEISVRLFGPSCCRNSIVQTAGFSKLDNYSQYLEERKEKPSFTGYLTFMRERYPNLYQTLIGMQPYFENATGCEGANDPKAYNLYIPFEKIFDKIKSIKNLSNSKTGLMTISFLWKDPTQVKETIGKACNFEPCRFQIKPGIVLYRDPNDDWSNVSFEKLD